MDDPLLIPEKFIESGDQSLLINERCWVEKEDSTSSPVELEKVGVSEVSVPRGSLSIDCQRTTTLVQLVDCAFKVLRRSDERCQFKTRAMQRKWLD
jgi:hypothetical protein